MDEFPGHAQLKAAQEELAQQQDVLGRFFTLSLDMLCIADVDGYFKRVNPAFGVLGYSAEELLSRPFLDFVHPDDRAATLAEVEKLGKGVPTIHFENRYRCKDGSYRWLAWATAPDPSGTLYAVARDITELKRKEEELRAALATTRDLESRFRWIFENSLDGILVTDTETGGITLANRAACELFGQSEDELRRRPRAGVVDSTDPRFVAALEEWRRTGRFRGELFLLRGDGSRFEAEYTATLFTADGMKRTAMIIRDITARRTAEHAQSRLAAIVNDSADAIIGRTLDGIVTSWNKGAERMFGYSAAEMVDQPIGVLFPRDRKGEEAHNAERIVRGERVEHFETVRLRKDGRQVEVSVTLSPVRDSAGNIAGVSKIVRDISELRQSQRELLRAKDAAEAASRELEAFSYSVAHDLRAPLRSIDGFSQALLEDCADALDDDGRKYLRHIRESAQLMAQLIDDMLMLSRVTRSELACQTIDLSELARAAAARLARNEPGRSVEVVIEEGLKAEGDPRLLAVVLDNLLGNAWKFTAKRSAARIEFGAVTKDGRLAYFVRDNGAGFDMAYAHKLFGVFQRLHAASEFEGTGVGLATVQRVVHRHGGRAWADGKVDAGATFYFTLADQERIQ